MIILAMEHPTTLVPLTTTTQTETKRMFSNDIYFNTTELTNVNPLCFPCYKWRWMARRKFVCAISFSRICLSERRNLVFL